MPHHLDQLSTDKIGKRVRKGLSIKKDLLVLETVTASSTGVNTASLI
jgi:hypothetical protein